MKNQKKLGNDQHFIAWAHDDQKDLIHINQAESGSNGYYCPVCSGELVAKKGFKNAHHFAHKNIVNSHESVLHFVAKHITASLIKSGNLNHINSYELDLSRIDPYSSNVLSITLDRPLLKPELTLVEKAFNDSIIPDVTTNSNSQNEKVAVEVYVTNQKKEHDIAKFKEASLSVLEINLSELPFDSSHKEIEIAINNQSNHKWLFLSDAVYPEQKSKLEQFMEEQERAKAKLFISNSETMLNDLLMDVERGNIIKQLTSVVDLQLTSITQHLTMKSKGLWAGEAKVNDKTCIPIYLVDREFYDGKIDHNGQPFFMREYGLYDYKDHWIDTRTWREKAIEKHGDKTFFKLKVPYEDRESAKALGATWSPQSKTWFTTSKSEQERIQRLLSILDTSFEP